MDAVARVPGGNQLSMGNLRGPNQCIGFHETALDLSAASRFQLPQAVTLYSRVVNSQHQGCPPTLSRLEGYLRVMSQTTNVGYVVVARTIAQELRQVSQPASRSQEPRACPAADAPPIRLDSRSDPASFGPIGS